MGGHPGISVLLETLDVPISQLSMNTLKKVAETLGVQLQDSCKNIVEDSTFVHDLADVLFATLEEESTTYASLPVVYHDICTWIALSIVCTHSSFSPLGRKEVRARLMEAFSNPEHVAPVGIEALTSADNASPIIMTKAEDTTPAKAEVNLINATQHAKIVANAQMMVKTSGIMVFDGLHNPERYLIYKFDVSELILGSGFASDKLLSMEILLATVRGVPLSNLRRLIGERDLYSVPSVGLLTLWESLDLLYRTPEATRFVMESFSSCKQGPSESLPAYVARFRRLAEVKRSFGGQLSELDLIAQFSCGLSSSLSLVARGICDPMTIASFDQYALQMTTVSRSLEPLINSNNIGNNAIKHDRKSLCHRCGDPTHKVVDCKRRVKYACRYCNSLDHFANVCSQRHKSAATMRRPMGEQKQSMLNNLNAVAEGSDMPDNDWRSSKQDTMNSVVTVSLTSIGLKDPRLIDTDEPLGSLDIFGNANYQTHCLHDTGAGANFIHEELATTLIRNGSIRKSGIIGLPAPIKVTYGNSDFEYADCYVTIKARRDSATSWSELLCLVTKSCSYPFILGRTGLKELGLMSNATHSTSLSLATTNIAHIVPVVPTDGQGTITMSHASTEISKEETIQSCSESEDRGRLPLIRITDDNRLMIKFGLMEDAHILPYRAPRRNRSSIDIQLIKAKLDQMVSEDKVEYCESRDCHMLHEIVLVDKKADQKLPRIFPDNLKRYRVTLDLRVGNDLELIDIGDTNALVPNKFAIKVKPTKTIYDHQYQTGAIEILRGLPANAHAYAKIDLDDAFQSVLLPPALRSLFCCVCQTAAGPVYFRWKSLPQGWKWSPIFFQIAVQYVLDAVRPELNPHVEVRHYQDDILILGADEEMVAEANKLMQAKFFHFGFRVNTLKCSIGTSTVFCGYHLSAAGITPAPKEPITSRFVDSSWSKFLCSSFEERLTLLRGWSGKFNYYVGFLPPAQLASLRVLYAASGKKTEQFDIQSLETAFKDLASFVLDGHIGTFPIGHIPNVICSVVVTDANANSYCGMLIRVCLNTKSSPKKQLREFQPLLTLVCRELKLDVDPDNLVVIPMRICGGTFSPGEQKQSSTYRERLCQLRCVDQFYTLVAGRCLVMSDNQNVGRTWHNLDETLSYGSNLVPWQRFIAIVHSTLWVPRDDPLMSLVDYAARLLDPTFQSSQKAQAKLLSARVDPADLVPVAPNGPRSRPVTVPILALPLREAIIDSYLQDTSTYLNVPMINIYHHLVHGTHSEPKTTNLSARFVYQDGLILHIRQRGGVQIYIPSGGVVDLHSDGPSTIRATILYHFHDAVTGLHRGYQHLVSTLSTLVWWPSLLADSLTYVKTCRVCQTTKARFTPFQGELRSIDAYAQPLQHWIVDYAGPINSFTSASHRYVLVAVCAFSSYTVLIPTEDSTASTTADMILERIVSQFGIPVSVYSDRGSQFNSDTIKNLNELLDIKWRLSASYSPRTNGLAERMVGQMKKILECMDFKEKCIPMIQLLHNSSLISSMPLSPFEVVYGFRPNISPLISVPESFEDVDKTEILEDIRSSWESFKSLMRDRTSDIYRSRSHVQEFHIGDQVMRVFVTGLYGPDRIKTTGPHSILEKASTNQYKLSGISFNVPEYQLHHVPTRPVELQVAPNTPIVGRLDPGVLIVFETFEEDVISYDVASIDSVSGTTIVATRFWFTPDETWRLWLNEKVSIDLSQVVAAGFQLEAGRLPPSLMNRLFY